MARKKTSYLKNISQLTIPLNTLKGIGPKRAEAMARKGLNNIIDILFYTPIRYEDRRKITPIAEAIKDRPCMVQGKIVLCEEKKYYRTRKGLFKILISDETGTLELLWFQYRRQHLQQLAVKGKTLTLFGRVAIAYKGKQGRLQMVHPEIILVDKGKADLGFHPIYSLIEGVSGRLIKTVIRDVLDKYLADIADPLPNNVIKKLGLPSLGTALKNVHIPPDDLSFEKLNDAGTPYHRRLLFDRFFIVMLALAYRKGVRASKSGPVFNTPSCLRETIENFLGFILTPSQATSVGEIAEDLSSKKPMARLLLGDVGCGKTAVAAAAAYIGVRNKYQVAIMTPTQVLAEQHMAYFSGLPKEMGLKAELLTGSLKTARKKKVYNRIESGKSNLIIGTHALIQKELTFNKLGLVIIDEQHRFGVTQRALIDRKGKNPHLLVMTATPIPRTLAITIYSDMDISFIRDFPAGHRPPETVIAQPEHKRAVFDSLKSGLALGRQAFVICPVIEKSEDTDLKNAIEMADRLKKIFSSRYKVGLIHGRLSPEEKDRVMAGFRKGLIHLLVGTSVIEVGVHVPNATLMIIEHPGRFGLAQLHQLRGRIGRGDHPGTCYLMVEDNIPDTSLERLEIILNEQNGSAIAQKDLELRGHGELAGMRQSGFQEIDYNELIREKDLLLAARKEAGDLIKEDPQLKSPEHRLLKELILSMIKGPVDL